MKIIDYVITDPEGVHALPAGGLVKLAQSFSSTITAKGNGQETDVKHVFGLVGLGVKCGQTLSITFAGEDEDQAADALYRYLKDNL
ncbi:HPr family phosphocarrier protein [Butyrivibrio sp. CB08]|uniref:HPr family phosphocarrier protein n=1 Tax=Butyrivibrio sp. CB08 TaxID=2364879 RepID=UPI000EA923A5|nr:HPr family phosphocarrier protein [Butyrivibrio sp. CB08]RKM59974.1 HPr family phosphocarrier protein [Butyrivibrio sp. CB08]